MKGSSSFARKVALGGVAALTVLVAVIAQPVKATRLICGNERRDVKMLVDPAASQIAFAPRATTVETLRALARPSRVAPTAPRLAPVEFRTYSLHVKLIAVTRASSLDTVLAVQGRTPGSTILIAFPDTHICLPNPGSHGGDIHSATDGLYADCGPAIPFGRWVPLQGTADIVGVGFWEPHHASTPKWSAPNGLTLHPALSFYAHGCLQPGGLPTG
jgi:hypothetical protein